jgi:putative salt-induced outer membrane protein YdiY
MKKLLLVAALSSCGFSYAEEPAQKEFTLDGELGLIFTTGNTETTSVKGRLSATHELTDWSNEYLVEGLYKQEEVENDLGEDESQTSAQRYFLSAQGNYKLNNPQNRLFAFASYEDDRFTSFDYQATLAGGWNSVWFESPTQKFSYSVGPGYSFAEKTDGEDVSGFIVRGAINYSWKISDTANFKQIISTETGSDNTKSKSETSVSAKLAEALSMKFSVILKHNTEVDDGVDNLDTETAATLVYTFF